MYCIALLFMESCMLEHEATVLHWSLRKGQPGQPVTLRALHSLLYIAVSPFSLSISIICDTETFYLTWIHISGNELMYIVHHYVSGSLTLLSGTVRVCRGATCNNKALLFSLQQDLVSLSTVMY